MLNEVPAVMYGVALAGIHLLVNHQKAKSANVFYLGEVDIKFVSVSLLVAYVFWCLWWACVLISMAFFVCHLALAPSSVVLATFQNTFLPITLVIGLSINKLFINRYIVNLAIKLILFYGNQKPEVKIALYDVINED